jgi:hypothetical protein
MRCINGSGVCGRDGEPFAILAGPAGAVKKVGARRHIKA